MHYQLSAIQPIVDLVNILLLNFLERSNLKEVDFILINFIWIRKPFEIVEKRGSAETTNVDPSEIFCRERIRNGDISDHEDLLVPDLI